ncbi:MAG: hypothetical protein JXA44_06200 [Methanospirillaceae archaeon]|nr:hypothetical protein [Methanospirillaceae archaeon]
MTYTCQIRLENNIILTIELQREIDLIPILQNSLYRSRMFYHPDLIAADLARNCYVTAIGKKEGVRDIFVDIDAVDAVLSISRRLHTGQEVCVYANTFPDCIRSRPEEMKEEWNTRLRIERKDLSDKGLSNDATL